MGINWPLIIIVGVGLLALLIFLIVRNQKDEKSFEEQLNEDYHKSKEEGDTDPEVLPK
jgi:hypothetical protein